MCGGGGLKRFSMPKFVYVCVCIQVSERENNGKVLHAHV